MHDLLIALSNLAAFVILAGLGILFLQIWPLIIRYILMFLISS